jgi:ferredoxin
MSKKIVVDANLCVGCGACADNHPDFFKMDEKTNHSKVIVPYDEAKKDEIEDAINSCPSSAIKIEN